MSKYIPNASTLLVSWTKSSYSAAQSDCVETAELGAVHVAVRDSKNPAGPALLFSRATMQAFAAAVRNGAYDR